MSFSPIFDLVCAFRFPEDVSFFKICYSKNVNKNVNIYRICNK